MKNKAAKKVLSTIFFPLLALGIAIAVWAIASKAYGNDLVLPMPDEVLLRFFTLSKEKYFWSSVGFTVTRSIIAFIISFVLSYPISLLAAKSSALKKILSTFVAILRAAPTVAVILILYAFLSGNVMSIVVGFLIAFPILFSTVTAAIERIDPNIPKMTKVYGVRRPSVWLHVYFLSISGTIFDVSRSTLSLTIKVMIAAEILTSVSRSVGGKIQTAYASFEIAYLLAWTILAIVLSFAAEIFVTFIKKIVVRWEQ